MVKKILSLIVRVLKAIALPFLLISIGFSISTLLYKNSELFTGIPTGHYSPIYFGQGISISINHSRIKKLDDEKLQLIIREDRSQPFRGESGLAGFTMISRVILDCKNEKIAIYSQTAYGPFLTPLETRARPVKLENPSSNMGVIAMVGLCGVKMQEQSKPTSPALIAHNKETNGNQSLQT